MLIVASFSLQPGSPRLVERRSASAELKGRRPSAPQRGTLTCASENEYDPLTPTQGRRSRMFSGLCRRVCVLKIRFFRTSTTPRGLQVCRGAPHTPRYRWLAGVEVSLPCVALDYLESSEEYSHGSARDAHSTRPPHKKEVCWSVVRFWLS